MLFISVTFLTGLSLPLSTFSSPSPCFLKLKIPFEKSMYGRFTFASGIHFTLSYGGNKPAGVLLSIKNKAKSK